MTQKENTMQLFNCDVSGIADYIVAANAAGDCLAIIQEQESREAFEEHEWADFKVSSVADADLDTKRFRSDEDGSMPTYREALARATSPQVIACSEW